MANFLIICIGVLLQLNLIYCQNVYTSSGTIKNLVDVTSTSYNELHKVLVLNQIENYIPVQDSIHTRPHLNLNGIYDFCFDDQSQGFGQKWHEFNLREKCTNQNFYRMPVPSAFNEIVSNTTVKNYIGWFWYQMEVNDLKLFKETGQSIPWEWYIQFENVNYMAIVWLQELDSNPSNKHPSHLVGSHVGGHLPFRLNITSLIASIGDRVESSAFRLTVAVNNNLTSETIPSGKLVDLSEQVGHTYMKFQPDFDFFHFAGIMGNVNLMKLHPNHINQIDQLYDHFESQELVGSKLNICISHHYWEDQKVEGQLELHSLSSNTYHLKKIDEKKVSHEIPCAILTTQSNPWTLSQGRVNSFSSLSTYRIKLKLLRKRPAPATNFFMSLFQSQDQTLSQNSLPQVIDVEEIDEVEVKNANSVPSGWRLDLQAGLQVNNKRQQLQGFGMHHEQFVSGRTMSQASILKDIYLLKQLGANVIRTSHYPYSVDYLNACDENGLLVIAECPAVGLNSFSSLKLALHKQILLEMMQRDHHHPSIIMWSVANEPRSQLPEAKEYFESLMDYARNNLARYTTKANRPLTAAIAQSHKDDKVAHTLDVIMINRYFGWYDYTGVIQAIRLPLILSLQGWAEKYPGKPIIVSEFGADAVAGLHSSTRDTLFSEEYQVDLVSQYEKVFDELYSSNNTNNPNLMFWGSMLWNFADFSTHNSLLRVGGNRKGILTRDRSPKMSFEKTKDIYQKRLVE